MTAMTTTRIKPKTSARAAKPEKWKDLAADRAKAAAGTGAFLWPAGSLLREHAKPPETRGEQFAEGVAEVEVQFSILHSGVDGGYFDSVSFDAWKAEELVTALDWIKEKAEDLANFVRNQEEIVPLEGEILDRIERGNTYEDLIMCGFTDRNILKAVLCVEGEQDGSWLEIMHRASAGLAKTTGEIDDAIPVA